jgi:hypothetical protein
VGRALSVLFDGGVETLLDESPGIGVSYCALEGCGDRDLSCDLRGVPGPMGIGSTPIENRAAWLDTSDRISERWAVFFKGAPSSFDALAFRSSLMVRLLSLGADASTVIDAVGFAVASSSTMIKASMILSGTAIRSPLWLSPIILLNSTQTSLALYLLLASSTSMN